MLHTNRATRPVALGTQNHRVSDALRLHRVLRCSALADSNRPPRKDDVVDDDAGGEWEGLTPEEDFEVPGSSTSILSQNTELGRAVSAACDEMHHLGSLEDDVLRQAEELLRKYGVKSSLYLTSPDESTVTGDEERTAS
jgi:hypothetical protein